MPAWWLPLGVELGRKIVERVKARRRKKMLDNLVKSWKTSLVGLLGSILISWQGGMSWRAIVSSLPTLILGLLAKDGDVSHSKPK